MNRNNHPVITVIYALLAIPIAFIWALFDLAKRS